MILVPIHWLALFMILLVIEILTLGLTTIWFAGGAFVAFVLCGFGAPWQLQAASFIAVSFVLLVFTRPWAKKYFNQKTVATNVEGLIGQKAVVTETIDNRKGTGGVLIGAQPWTARSMDDTLLIPAGATVTVERISGVKAMVRIKEEKTEK